jgi:hypothetical protein
VPRIVIIPSIEKVLQRRDLRWIGVMATASIAARTRDARWDSRTRSTVQASMATRHPANQAIEQGTVSRDEAQESHSWCETWPLNMP